VNCGHTNARTEDGFLKRDRDFEVYVIALGPKQLVRRDVYLNQGVRSPTQWPGISLIFEADDLSAANACWHCDL
jgi:hypothetical protein